MGVDLKDLLVRRERTLDDLKGTYAVDAFNTLYQFITIIRQPDGTPLMHGGKITSHVSGLFYRTCSMLEKGIFPVYVFDGEPHELKKKTIAERAQAKAEAEELMRKAREAGRTEEAAKLAQRTARLTKDMVVEAKELLEMMGLPFVQAPSEGEAQCAWMASEGIVDAAASQDYDSLLFGAPRLMRNITISGRRKIPYRNAYAEVVPEEVLLEESLSALGITRQKLVWIGILIGTDFNEGVHGIGPKKALKLVKEFDSFDSINQKTGQQIDYAQLEDLFMKPAHVQIEKSQLKPKEPQHEKILEFMVEARGFSKERVENSLARAFKTPEDTRQNQLKKWF